MEEGQTIQWRTEKGTKTVWRYQRGNQKPKMEGHTIQCLKDREKTTNNDLQNTTHETKGWIPWNPLKNGVNSGQY